MSNLIISKKDESFISLSGEAHILQELSDRFSFYADNYRFHPSYKMKKWDGKIRMLRRINNSTAELYYGLLDDVILFCNKHSYSYELAFDRYPESINQKDLEIFLSSLNISSRGQPIVLRDYQSKGFYDAIQNKRQLILSVTSSGKSAIIYSIMRYLNFNNLNGLIVVPNVSLINQIHNDFLDYSELNGWDVDYNVHKIYSGQEKYSEKPIHLSTWQSISAANRTSGNKNENKNSRNYDHGNSSPMNLQLYDYVIIDECLEPNTPIKMGNGEIKQIKNIKIGDTVITLNENTNILECNAVVKVHKNLSSEKMFKIIASGKELHITGNHKIFTKRGWVRVDELTLNDEIFLED